MPRIQMPTVAEHRAAQRRALLDAARALLAENGARPTISAVAARTGLARPSVYQYFTSAEDLLNALMEDVFPRWSEQVSEDMDAAPTSADRVLAYVRANFRLVAGGEHALATALAEIAPGEEIAEKTRNMHEQLLDPLVAALRDLGVPQVEATAEMINSVVHTGSRLIEAGDDQEATWECARRLLDPFLRSVAAEPETAAPRTTAPPRARARS